MWNWITVCGRLGRSKAFSKLRLKLFQSVVTPTVLYGSGSWVMTMARQTKLKSAQFKMLRCILGRRRLILPGGDTETWVEWVKRTTEDVREMLSRHNINSWIEDQTLRAQRWRDKVENMSSERWAKRVAEWTPEGYRRRGHPVARWSDADADADAEP